MMDSGLSFQRPLGTQQEIQVYGQLYLLASRHLTVGPSVKKEHGLQNTTGYPSI